MGIEFVPASPAHVGTLANRLRDIDRRECLDIVKATPKEAIRYGLMYGEAAFTAKVDGRPEAVFGVVTSSYLEGKGRPWLLLTDEAVKHARELVVFGKLYTERFLRHYETLENLVHAENDTAIRWLRHIGYHVGEVELRGSTPVRSFRLCALQSSQSQEPR